MPFLKLSFWFNRVFEIVRCKFCGSSGTHRKCSSLKLYDTNWSCGDCKAAVEGKGELNQTIKVSEHTKVLFFHSKEDIFVST